ncbi:FkbM family methyltransferase [Desertivirga xinjiangensis]|uniref:FkbM family methyltransferase n=1 Tax=Desertivirga xinjiangensis TaxID=539206 RepID=UPI00210CE36D|nr:FkbM family methyltransferase [Pedobacter xinjiangensis]
MNIIKKLRYKIESTLRVYKAKANARQVRTMILNYYRDNQSADPEMAEAVEYLKSHPLKTFFGRFVDKYRYDTIIVSRDASNGLYWVNHDGKRLYFKRSYNVTTIKMLYNGLLMEQDPMSPHSYTDSVFNVSQGDFVIDVGAAEGIFTLNNIDKVQKAFLFERDPEWLEALEATFEPWKNKVKVICKFVSDVDDEERVSIDVFAAEEQCKIDFVKVDVEGAEEQVLQGMENTMRTVHPKIALCTYHKQDDFNKFSSYLSRLSYHISTTPGVMYFNSRSELLKPPFFRKGLIRAVHTGQEL